MMPPLAPSVIRKAVEKLPSDRTQSSVTARSIVLGALCIAVLSAANPYLMFITRIWSVGSGSLLGGPVVVLLLLVMANGVGLRWLPGLRLTRGELLVVYGMMIISVGFLSLGGLPYMVSAATFPFYLASPENGWDTMMWSHIPSWMGTGPSEATRWFWEGLPPGARVPWGTWVTPALTWGGFTVALMAAMFCLGALMRKDWIERQRLTFPLVDVPLAIAGDAERPSLRSSLLSNRVFWIGFAIPAFFAALGWLHTIAPNVPLAPVVQNGVTPMQPLEIGRALSARGLPWNSLSFLSLTIIFPVIGITCLLPTEVSLSLWLFYALYIAQMIAWASCGFSEGGASTAIQPRAFIGAQEAGGIIALSAALLYQSRATLKEGLTGLIRRQGMRPDPFSPLSPRASVAGFLIANGAMTWWAVSAGMSWWSLALLLGLFYATLICASRLVAAGGIMYVDFGTFPRSTVMRTIGAAPIGAPSLTIYAFLSVIYMCDPMNLAMPQMMNSFKLLHTGRVRARRWAWGGAIAVIVMLAVGTPALISTITRQGAITLDSWPFYDYPHWIFGQLAAALRTPDLPDNWGRLAMAVGAAFTLLIVWLHSTFVWWPVSPIGFLIASSWETNRSLWFNALVAWLLSVSVRRYGGLRLYRAMRPAFLGLVLGQYLSSAFFAVLSAALGIHQPATT